MKKENKDLEKEPVKVELKQEVWEVRRERNRLALLKEEESTIDSNGRNFDDKTKSWTRRKSKFFAEK